MSQTETKNTSPLRLARRQLLLLGTGFTTALLTGLAQTRASAQTPVSPLSMPASHPAGKLDLRTDIAYRLRLQAAQPLQQHVTVTHPTNGDEARYPLRIGSFSKGLPHNALGEVDPDTYQALVNALLGRRSCETIPLGGKVKLANPQAAFWLTKVMNCLPYPRLVAWGSVGNQCAGRHGLDLS